MTVTSVTWGQALDVRLRRYPGGWKGATQRIEAALGPVADSRATVMKLKNVPDVAALTADERWRAWLVLTVIGELPGTWGVDDERAIPPGIDRTRLRRALASNNSTPGGAESHDGTDHAGPDGGALSRYVTTPLSPVSHLNYAA